MVAGGPSRSLIGASTSRSCLRPTTSKNRNRFLSPPTPSFTKPLHGISSPSDSCHRTFVSQTPAALFPRKTYIRKELVDKDEGGHGRSRGSYYDDKSLDEVRLNWEEKLRESERFDETSGNIVDVKGKGKQEVGGGGGGYWFVEESTKHPVQEEDPSRSTSPSPSSSTQTPQPQTPPHLPPHLHPLFNHLHTSPFFDPLSISFLHTRDETGQPILDPDDGTSSWVDWVWVVNLKRGREGGLAGAVDGVRDVIQASRPPDLSPQPIYIEGLPTSTPSHSRRASGSRPHSRSSRSRPTSSDPSEGSPNSKWALIDAGNVVVHVMTEEARLTWDVLSVWRRGDGPGEGEELAPGIDIDLEGSGKEEDVRRSF